MDARPDEELLLAYARSDDKDALGELVRRRWPEAYRIALRLLDDPGAAEDAAQEALCNLVRAKSEFDSTKSFGPWFGTLVLNAARMGARSRARRVRHERAASVTRPVATGGEGERRVLTADLQAALDELPFDERAPIVLHHLEGRSLEEVAQATGSKKSTVQSRIGRGLEHLREALAATGGVFSIAQVGDVLRRESGRNGSIVAPKAPTVAALEEGARAPRRLARRARTLAIAATGAVIVAVAALSFGALSRNDGPGGSSNPSANGPVEVADSKPSGVPTNDPPVPPAIAPLATKTSGAAPTTPAARRPGLLVTVKDRAGRPLAGTAVFVHVNPSDEAERLIPTLKANMPVEWVECAARRTVTTDAHGKALVEDLAPSARVILYARSKLESARASVAFPEGRTEEVALALSPFQPQPATTCAIVFRVTTPQGTLANQTLPVELRASEGSDAREEREKRAPGSQSPWQNERGNVLSFALTVETDAEGRFFLRDLAPASYMLDVKSPAVAGLYGGSFWGDVHAGETKEVELDFKATTAVSGRVTGELPKGTFVLVKTSNGGGTVSTVQDDGHWEQAGITVPNHVTVTAFALGRAAVSTAVDVPTAAPVVAPDLAFGAGATVTGRIVTSSGQPLGDVTVVLERRRHEGRVAVAKAGPDGAFEITGVPPGHYRLGMAMTEDAIRDEKFAGHFFQLMSSSNRLEKEIEVGSDPVVALGDLAVHGTLIQGTVVLATGEPAGGAEVELVSSDPGKTTADDLGRFTFEDREPWSGFGIIARKGLWFMPEKVSIDGKDTTNVKLTLVAGAAVSGTLSPAPGKKEFFIRANAPGTFFGPSAPVGEDGRYRLVLLPGVYKVDVCGLETIRNGNLYAPVEVSLAALEEKTVDFAAPAAPALTVRVNGFPDRGPDDKESRRGFEAIAYKGSLKDGLDLVGEPSVARAEKGVAKFARLEQAPDGVCVDLSPFGHESDYFLWREPVGAASEVVFDYPVEKTTGKLSLVIDLANRPPREFRVFILGDGVLVVTEIRKPEDKATVAVPLPPGNYRVVVPEKEFRRGDKLDVSKAQSVAIEAQKAASLTVTLPEPK